MLRQTLFITGCLLVALTGCTRKPLTPAVPWTDIVDDSLCFLAATTDPSGLQLEYTFDWGGGPTFTTRRYHSGDTAYARHSFYGTAWYEIRVDARNENGKSSAWSAPLRFRKSNPPVVVDSILGPTRCAVNHFYRASVKVTDPDGDSVSVKFIWDGSEGGTWTAFGPSGSIFTDSCLWSATGLHMVKVIARDQGNMAARPESAKTVSVSGMGVTWYSTDERWYYATPTLGSVDGEPVIYCPADEGMVCYSLDGELRWTSATSSSGTPSASLSADGSRLYLPGDNGLVCLDARTGRTEWLAPFDTVPSGSAECTPAVGPDGAIYVTVLGWYDYQLCRVKDCGDSAVIVRLVDLGGSGPSAGEAVVSRSGVVYVLGGGNGCYNQLFAIDSTGAVLWSDSSTIQMGATPVIDSRDRILVADELGNIYCFNPDGSLAWTAVTSELYPGSLAVGQDDEVIATDCNGAIIVFDSDGRQKWSLPLDIESMDTPCVTDGGSIIVYDPGYPHVYCVRRDGELQWEYSIIDSLDIEWRAKSANFLFDPAPVIGNNGDLYLTSDYRLFSLSGTNLHVANTAWPTYNHDNAHSGWAGRP